VTCALLLSGFCRQIEHVQPVDWRRYAVVSGVRPNDTFGQTLTAFLQNEARYELKWVAADQNLVTNMPGWEGVIGARKASARGNEDDTHPQVR
jgi:hypothetical protein